MSVGFLRAVDEGLRYNGVPSSFEPGCETRGNGQRFPEGKPEGLLVHHTGATLGGGLTVLLQGRPDLAAPLCNSCIYPNGRVHHIAAHPANHAGASGGKSMGPLPVTTLFNRRVWGVEIMFPGTTPWTPAQYRSARVLGGVISGILCRPNPEWVRGHSECSRTGKWDPGAGRGPGVPFDMQRFRAEIWTALQEDKLTSEEHEWLRRIFIESTQALPSRAYPGAPGKDTVLGYAANADGYGYRLEKRIVALEDKVDQLLARLPKPGLPTAPKESHGG